MKYLLILVLVLSADVFGCGDGFYMEGGLLYNTDAYEGIGSNKIASVAVGYEANISESFILDIKGRHESDPEYSGQDDWISNDSYGAFLRYKF